MNHNDLAAYFLNQSGRGSDLKDFVLYRGRRYQKGRGLFGALRGLWRFVAPIFKGAAKTVGREAVSVGANVLTDAMSRKPLKQSLKQRLKEGGANLKRKADDAIDSMIGSGLKRRRVKKTAHSAVRRSRRRKYRDIFS